MSKIINSDFRRKFDYYGVPITEFACIYRENDIPKIYTIRLDKDISMLTQDDIDYCFSKAEHFINGGSVD